MLDVVRTCCAVVLVLALAACGPGGESGSAPGGARSTQPAASADQLAIVMTIDPLTVGTSTVTANVSAGGEPEVGATVTVRGDMTHAGMAPVIAELTEDEAGVYVTNDFELTMAGDWIITVEVEATDGRTAKLETFESVAAR